MTARLLVVAALLLASSASVSAQAWQNQWFVILQSLPGNAESAADKARLSWNKRCKIATQTSSTNIIIGLQPDLQIVFVGPFKARSAAARTVASLKKCAPGAFMKQGSWSGE